MGHVQPTIRSQVYTFELKYKLGEMPNVKILSPELIKNSKGENIPHMYIGNKLCLFRPKYFEFCSSDYIADTIIPWISLWLYYYEIWHLTNEWLGGGEHPYGK